MVLRKASRRVTIAAIVLVLATTAPSGARAPRAGELDQDFGVGGYVELPFNVSASRIPLTLMPGGKIVTAGRVATGTYPVDEKEWLHLGRFLPGGTPDRSFGANGVVRHEDDGEPIAAAADGERLVLASCFAACNTGYLRGGVQRSEIRLERFTADGALDPTFGRNGRVTYAPPYDYRFVRDMVVQPDRRIVVVGVMRQMVLGGELPLKTFVMRFMPDGAIDATFGVRGTAIVELGGPRFGGDFANAIALRPDGRIVISGAYGYAAGVAVAQLTPDGRPDLSFGTLGRAGIEIPTAGFPGAALAIDRRGRIVTAGSAHGPSGWSDFLVTRFTRDGKVDASFGDGGVVYVDFSTRRTERYDQGASVAIQHGNRIVVGGTSVDNAVDYHERLVLVRLKPSGALDRTFHGDGRAMPKLQCGSWRSWHAGSDIALTRGEDILASGNCLVRLHG